MRRAPDARLHARGRLLAAEAPRGQNRIAGVPRAHWKRLRTNNVQERANGEIKRRSRAVQVFPPESSLLRLMGAVMCDQAEA